MKSELTLAFNEVLEEKQLPKDVIIAAIESAIVSAYRRSVNAPTGQRIEAKIDIDTGKVTVYAEKEVVEDVENPLTEVTLSEARSVEPEAALGDTVLMESTPKEFGRVAAQTARQVVQQRIRDAEQQAQMDLYGKQVGEIVGGIVQAITSQGYTIGLEMRAEGILPHREVIPGEKFRIHDRVRALVAEVRETIHGPEIILSRTHRNFLRRLLENEVPEIYHGIVEIRSIAREPGSRAKVAVSTNQVGIDPVGACVGQRGMRIQAIVRELHDEKIDVIEWNADPAIFIAKALSPARVSGVFLREEEVGKTATVIVPEDQLSLAIGRDGQNARLAAKLTNWRIDIKSLTEAASEAMAKLQSLPELASLVDFESDLVHKAEDVLARAAEGRAPSMDENALLAHLVDLVEHGTAKPVQQEKEHVIETVEEEEETIAPQAFEVALTEDLLPKQVLSILRAAGYKTVGDVMLQVSRNSDQILRLEGIGPRAMDQIRTLIESMQKSWAPAEEAEAAEETGVEEPASEVAEATEATEPTEPIPTEAVEPVEEETAVPESSSEAEATVEAEPQTELAAAGEPVLQVQDAFPAYEEKEEGIEDPSKKTAKKKHRKTVAVEYDPDKDTTVVLRRHKRGESEWPWEE